MNYISHDTIFCAFPRKTLKYKGLRNFTTRWYTKVQTEALHAALKKYIDRGFVFSGDSGLWPRYWGDDIQWVRHRPPLVHLYTV
jgi:hypothetical protein